MPNKDVERKAKELHLDLLDALSSDLGEREVKKFKKFLRNDEYGGFRSRELEEMEDIGDVFEAQEKRRVFSVGKYSKLKEQLVKIKNEKLVEEVRKYEEEMRSIGFPIMYRAESMDADPAPNGNKPSSPAIVPFSPGPFSPGLSPISPGFPTHKEPEVCYAADKGYVLYISNFFKVNDKLGNPRPGVKVDEQNLSSFFSEKGCHFDFWPDIPTPQRLWDVIDMVKLKIENSYSSFFFIISSHGKGITLKDKSGNDVLDKDTQKPVVISEGIQMVENDSHVRVDEIVSKFENFMIGKPKVLIFQACRSVIDRADDSSSPVSFYDAQQYCPVTIPGNADMVIIHDTSRGGKGWRNEDQGAWLFYCMCVELKHRFNTEHLLDVLTRINNKISVRDACDKDGKSIGKQMPCYTSTFTKFFYLTNQLFHQV